MKFVVSRDVRFVGNEFPLKSQDLKEENTGHDDSDFLSKTLHDDEESIQHEPTKGVNTTPEVNSNSDQTTDGTTSNENIVLENE